MIEDALRYQTQGDDWLKRVAIGGGVLFLGFLLVPLFTFQGYMLEVMRRVMRGETETPPAWGDLDLVETTVDGVRHTVVVLGYGLALLVVLAVPGVVMFVGIAGESGALAVLGVLVGGLVYLAGVLAMAAVLPVATGNFVKEDSIAAGFDLDVLRAVVTNRTMLMAVLMAFAVNIIVSAVSSVLGFTIVGYLLVPFVAFVGQSGIMYIWAEGFADAYEEEYGEPPLAPEAGFGAGTDATTGVRDESTDRVAGETDDDSATGWDDDSTSAWDDDSTGDWDDTGDDRY
ncbi:DUF4013 domain-containing protein [Haloarcula salina]|uniref:DUF4013 domain-containing protein n=1 Tax=Haloarcula salina TaxID=1429914 RepID=A0AA41KB44_9EURY|nr:DUF4013 domain-containing protein [Haloarcula salina]MBV0900550.1 DUF4013 domain-containing protein [Haloarcula salina]